MKSCERVTNNLMSTIDRLDQIRMSPGERQAAGAYLRQGELIAAMLMRANADLHRVFRFVGRGIDALARRSKVPAATPECRLP